MAVPGSWSSERWLPVAGRAPVCRLDYCHEAATDDVRRLCEWHGRWQRGRSSHDDRLVDKAAKRAYIVELLTPPHWMAQAACKDHPDVDFYLAPGDDTGPAVAVCQACPVRAECAEAGLEEHFGIWGGTTARERARRAVQ
jgi:WhiB family redox-sensing transcriptional regulator